MPIRYNNGDKYNHHYTKHTCKSRLSAPLGGGFLERGGVE